MGTFVTEHAKVVVMVLGPIRNTEEYSEFVRNYIGDSLSMDTLEAFKDEISKDSIIESKPGTVLGCFLVETLKIAGVTYAPKLVKRGNGEVWFNFATETVTYSKGDEGEDWDELQWGALNPWVIIGRALEALGIMEYIPAFTGAEAQDYKQIDSDVEPEQSIGYKTE